MHQVEAGLCDAHPNKWCFQVNKTAEKSSQEAEERTCHLRAQRKKYGNLQRGSVPAPGARGTGLGGFPAPAASLFLRHIHLPSQPRGLTPLLRQGDDFSAVQPLAQVTARFSGESISRTARRTPCQPQGRDTARPRCRERAALALCPQCQAGREVAWGARRLTWGRVL